MVWCGIVWCVLHVTGAMENWGLITSVAIPLASLPPSLTQLSTFVYLPSGCFDTTLRNLRILMCPLSLSGFLLSVMRTTPCCGILW